MKDIDSKKDKEGSNSNQEKDGQLAKDKELKEIVEPIINSELSDAKKIDEIVRSISVREEYSGPLPPPSMLEGYQRILPDAAERILTMAEKELEYRHEHYVEMLYQDRKKLEGLLSANKISQIFAFILVIILIGVGGILTYLGHTAVGLTIFGTTILSVASTFIIGFVKNKSNSPKDKEPLKR